MKHFSLFAVLIFLLTMTGTVFGQDAARQTTRHELRLGSGFLPMPSFKELNTYDPGPLSSRHYYLGNQTYSPSAFLSYTYRFKSWISFGGTFTYSGNYQNSYNLYTDELRTKDRDHYLGITPTVRFDWSRGGLVGLYSSVGVGIGIEINRHKSISSGFLYGRSKAFATIDVVPIGISVGRKLFGFCELGVGTNGIARAGIGYRFNSKKSR